MSVYSNQRNFQRKFDASIAHERCSKTAHQFNAEIENIEERLANLFTEKQLRLKPALEGKRKKAGERMKERLTEIERRRDIGHSCIDVAYGVINVV